MYVGLIVRDNCERSVKTQVSKNVQVDFTTGSQLSREKLTREKSHVLSTWLEDEESSQVVLFASVSRVRPTCEGLVKHSVWQKVMFFFTLSLHTLYIHSLPTNCKECFLEREP